MTSSRKIIDCRGMLEQKSQSRYLFGLQEFSSINIRASNGPYATGWSETSTDKFSPFVTGFWNERGWHWQFWEQAQLPLFHDSNAKWDSAGVNQEGKRQQGKNTDQQLLEEREETRHTIFVRTNRKLVPLSWMIILTQRSEEGWEIVTMT